MFFNADPASDGRIVEDIGIGLHILSNEHSEVRYKRLSFHTCALGHKIAAVWERLRDAESIFICYKDIPFRFFCIFKAAGACEIDFKLSTSFRLLHHTGVATRDLFVGVNIFIPFINVLNQLNLAFFDLFRKFAADGIEFYGVKPRFRAYGILSFVQQVPFAGCDFFEYPSRIADIVSGHKGTVRIGGEGINQLAVVV